MQPEPLLYYIFARLSTIVRYKQRVPLPLRSLKGGMLMAVLLCCWWNGCWWIWWMCCKHSTESNECDCADGIRKHADQRLVIQSMRATIRKTHRMPVHTRATNRACVVFQHMIYIPIHTNPKTWRFAIARAFVQFDFFVSYSLPVVVVVVVGAVRSCRLLMLHKCMCCQNWRWTSISFNVDIQSILHTVGYDAVAKSRNTWVHTTPGELNV